MCSRASYGSPARTGFADENLAIHACPSDSRICGTDKYIEFKKDGSTGTSKTIRISTGLLGTNSCTYLVKSECSAVTMTQGPNWNWSAPGTNYKIIVSEWAEKEITKNAATSSEYVVSSENVYTAWPVKGTTTVSVDDQTPFYSTEYGYRKQVIAAATSSAPL